MQFPLRLRQGLYKPAGIPRINWAHPLAYKLAACYVPVSGSAAYDLTGQLATLPAGSNSKLSVTSLGQAWSFDGSGNSQFSKSSYAPMDAIGTGDFTLAGIAAPTTSGNGSILAQRNGGSFYNFGLFSNVDNTDNGNSGWFVLGGYNGSAYAAGAASLVDGKMHAWLGLRTAGTLRLYRDAVQQGSDVSMSSSVATGGTFSVGGIPGYSEMNGTSLIGCWWNRALALDEIALWSRDPFCFLSFAEDDLFATLAGIAGHLVTQDYTLPGEWLLATRRDQALPLEFAGTLRKDAGAALEWQVGLREDGAAGLEIAGRLAIDAASPLEFAARVARDGSAAIELAGAVRGDRALPFEWTGALAIAADAFSPFAWDAALRSDSAAPFSFAARLSVDDGSAAEILVAVRRAGAQPFGFDLAVCGDPDTPLEWYAPAVILHATLLALARRRRRIATPLPRHLTITFRPNTMSQTQDLSPPIDAIVEQEIVGFDFGPVLADGVTITSVVGVTCAVYRGADANPAARLLGAAQLAPSQATGAPDAQVNQLVGTMLAGATYRLQCTVATSDGQTLDLWTHLACVAVI